MRFPIKGVISTFFILAGAAFIIWLWLRFFSVNEEITAYDIAMFVYFTSMGLLFASLPFIGNFLSWVGDSRVGTFFKPKQTESEFHIQDIITFIGELGVVTYLFSTLTSYLAFEDSSPNKYCDGILAVAGTLIMFLLSYYSLVKLMKRGEKSENRLV